jgi:hypothetical protein
MAIGAGKLCSKLCSDRVGKRRIVTLRDKLMIGGFSAKNNAFRCDLREADRALPGLATAAFGRSATSPRMLSLTEISTSRIEI